MIKYSKVIYAPQVEVVDVTTTKANMYVTGSDRDTVIARLITSATKLCETYAGRSFIKQTRQLKLDRFPLCSSGEIFLPYGPVIAISGNDSASPANTLGLSYVDSDGATQTLVLDTDFYLDTNGNLSRIAPVDDWPTDVDDDRISPITITYTAGYGSAASDVDPIAIEAVLCQVAFMHENPDKAELCEGAMSLLDQIKVYHNAWQD